MSQKQHRRARAAANQLLADERTAFAIRFGRDIKTGDPVFFDRESAGLTPAPASPAQVNARWRLYATRFATTADAIEDVLAHTRGLSSPAADERKRREVENHIRRRAAPKPNGVYP